MRRIREVLRLRAELGPNLSAIAAGARLARSTVRAYLARAAAAGLEAGAKAGLSDTALEAALFPPTPAAAGRAMPDWAAIDQELRRHKHVTRKLLWLEYKAEHPDGFEFSQFKLRLSEWQKASGRGLSMRQVHHAGETVQVDYAGDTVSVADGGTVRAAQIFVACLPCSGLIYAEASWTQTQEDWLASHVRLFAFPGGVPAKVVPDNLKASVTHASYHDPVINASYAALIKHYGTAVVPARVRRPRDKPGVENGVLQACRWLQLHRGPRDEDIDPLAHQLVRRGVEVPVDRHVVVDVDRGIDRPLAGHVGFRRQGPEGGGLGARPGRPRRRRHRGLCRAPAHRAGPRPAGRAVLPRHPPAGHPPLGGRVGGRLHPGAGRGRQFVRVRRTSAQERPADRRSHCRGRPRQPRQHPRLRILPLTIGAAPILQQGNPMYQPTIEKLHALRLGAMADALTAQLRQPEIDAMPFSERLAVLVDIQHSAMLNAALEQRLRRAGMRQSACMENLDLRTPRGLDRSSIQALASGQWIRQHRNVLISGPADPDS